MEIVYFVLGIVAVLLVLGVVVIVKVSKKVNELTSLIGSVERQIDDVHRRIDDENLELASHIKETLNVIDDIKDILHKRIDDEVKDIVSMVDSRLDKLENKITSKIPPTNSEVIKELEKVREEFLSLRINL